MRPIGVRDKMRFLAAGSEFKENHPRHCRCADLPAPTAVAPRSEQIAEMLSASQCSFVVPLILHRTVASGPKTSFTSSFRGEA